jgi:hypothetical protein
MEGAKPHLHRFFFCFVVLGYLLAGSVGCPLYFLFKAKIRQFSEFAKSEKFISSK